MEKDDFDSVSTLLQKTTILNSDFEGTISHAIPGDFVYLDPPYIPIDATASFTSYHADGFGLPDQERLAQKMLDLKEAGVKAMCSNSDTPLTREIYGSLNQKTIQAPRMVSAKASGRGSISELVITNY
jgi:DNA adenine methylase